MSLDPKEFDTIQDYITKAHELRSMVKDCGITIEDEKLINNLMRKLPPEYASFVSSFNTYKLTLGSSYTMPSVDSFTEMLMVEQSNLMGMEILKSSKYKALVASKGKGKGSNKKQKSWQQNSQETEHSTSSPQDNSNNKGKSPKMEMLTCAYCKKNGHEEHHCYKEIDELKNLLKKNQMVYHQA